MQQLPVRAHPDCVTARPDFHGPALDETGRALVRAAVEVVEAVGGYGGGVYLRSTTDGLLRLAVLVGLPAPLFRPWWRMQVNRPYPVAEAYRSGHAVHLSDAESTMRLFPQLMAGLPFAFGSLYEPVAAGDERYGVLMVLRTATPGAPVGREDRQRMRGAAAALSRDLAGLTAAGAPVVWDADPLVVEPPGPPADASAALGRLPQALLSLDRLGRVGFVSAGADALLGADPAAVRGRVLWEALPWLGQPVYEDHFRAAYMSGEPIGFLAVRPSGDWISVDLHPGDGGISVLLTAARAPASVHGSAAPAGAGPGSPAERAAVVYRPVAMAIALTEAVTARQVSAVVTEELLPAFGGRQLAIYLLNERHLHLAWETGFPKGFLNRFDGVGLDVRLPGVETLTSGRPIFFESMQHLATAYPGIPMDTDVGARAFLPLIASGRPVGSCILGFDAPRSFSAEERTVLTALAGLIAQALERAQRYDTEAALARGLQAALLPTRLPVLEHVDTVARYLAGTQGMDVGGDWYDVIETEPGLLALVIGDVQGHGVAAAATMGQLRSAVRAFAFNGSSPQEVMSGTNRLLIGLDPGQFASCCYVLLDPATGRALAVRAGHPQPLLRHADGRTEVLDLPGGVVLGIDPRAAYPVTALTLEPGAVLALYTDGLVEQPGTDIDVGVERLRASLAAAGPGPLTETADRLISEAGQAADRPDDIALLLAARTAGGPARR
ncbi:SpoIIE family protein phosphatase [Streptomyces sp. NPDC006529]|uniref:SpoIIE family protein phosphatase n=1 Tax=Streptomyces sp. NPDC006529 TaxID=3157177 RepID=UPI0033B9347D